MILWRGMVLRRDISFVFDGKRGYFGTGDFKALRVANRTWCSTHKYWH